jgi:exoribonuclease-2
MLPPQVTEHLGLGLQERSPALSFGFTLSPQGEVENLQIQPSWIQVERISYRAAEIRLGEEPFVGLLAKSQTYRQRRQQAGAASIELPEVKLKVREGKVEIESLPRLQSREMVTDLMLMAGEGVADYCQAHEIAIPFATQATPEQLEQPVDLAGMYAYRRFFKPTKIKTQPELHAGLGLPCYTRVTSPLRRYSDLLAHQQLRAHLKGNGVVDIHTVSECIAQAEMASMANRKTERVSNDHWRLIYLRDNPHWQDEAVVVAKEGERATVLIPSIAMEAKLRIRGDVGLNDRIRLKPREIDIPDLSCYFRMI